MNDKCIISSCHTRFKDSDKTQKLPRHLDSKHNSWLKSLLTEEGLSIGNDSKICKRCYTKYLKKRPRPDYSQYDEAPDSEYDMSEGTSSDNTGNVGTFTIPLLTVDDLKYASSSHRRCSVCLQYNDNCINIPKSARHTLVIKHQLWCSPDARVCPEHLIGSFLHPDTMVSLMDRSPLQDKLDDTTSSLVINDLFELIHEISSQGNSAKLQFKKLSDSDCHAWTGWSLEQFRAMYGMCESALLAAFDHNLCLPDMLLYFWAKLKTNLSWKEMTVLANMPRTSLSRSFYKIVDILNTAVVPKFLGTTHITREEALEHNTAFTKTFYGEKVSLIFDGTYIYINKSNDHQFQRASYGGQKKRNYLKFMSIVLPDGYVLDTIGPYYGSVNDATITKRIIEHFDVLKSWLQDNDNVIVDRGFRDILDVFADLGFDAKMPSFLPAGKSQTDTMQGNNDRLCTKTRWVVESYHGRLKRWVFFKDQLPSNYYIQIIDKLVRIVTACLNCFRGPIYKPNQDQEQRDLKMAQRMLARVKEDNALAKRVEDDPDMSRRAKSEWKKLESSNISFPHLDLEYLETIACGTYQIKLSAGYISEHQTENGDYEVWVYQHANDILRGQIHSRHKSQTKYNVWIQFDVKDPEDPVKAYYCICPAGKKTSGMCAHVASILYYLGHYMHIDKQKPLQPICSRFKNNIL